MIVVPLSRTIFVYRVATQDFLFIGMESSVLFVGLLYISFIVDC